MRDLTQRYESYSAKLADYGQEHLLRFWSSLSDPQRAELLVDLDQIDFERAMPLVDEFVRQRPSHEIPDDLQPADTLPYVPDPDHAELYERAAQRGVEAIRAGQVAAFTVAGGQGTRLGFDGPKGAYPISPVRDATLFQLFAEYLLGVERRYGARPRWYIMTSPLNHDETLHFFESGGYFGLDPSDVSFFQQAQMPVFHPDGRIALAERHRIALSPDGHGGSLHALHASGALADMRERGIEQISYFQVDNPIVHPIDPRFIGLHCLQGSQMSSKAVRKAHDLERVGNFCKADGKVMVIEYSDIPEELATAKNPDGSRRFDSGSIAIHVIDRAFVEELTTVGGAASMPWHRADKKVAVVDENGEIASPDQPNVVKLELFIFDAIPLAKNPLVLYTERGEEFSPVKNAEGDDSPATSRRDQIRRAARWLEFCGVSVPRGADSEPALKLEISPNFALDVHELRERLVAPPELKPGQDCVLA